MNLGIVQITSPGTNRLDLLVEKIIPRCIEISDGRYTLVSSSNKVLYDCVTGLGGTFVEYNAWERDMSRKWREGLETRKETWVGMFADDILPDSEWKAGMETFLNANPPGQYGFRLTDTEDLRHPNGEDWMQAADERSGSRHRPLWYDADTGAIEQSSTAYVANCVAHQEAVQQVQPFGVFGMYPDVMWSMALRCYGYPIGFNPKARAYHLGDRNEYRDNDTHYYHPTIKKYLSQLSDQEFINLAYQILYFRYPDTQGEKHWLEKLRSGMSRHAVIEAFTKSREFNGLYRTSSESGTSDH